MAIRTYTSGDLPTSNRYIVFNIQIVLESQSIEGNYSNVTVREIYRRTNTGYQTYGTGTCYAQIDGTEYTQAVSPSQRIVGSDMGSPITLFERNVNIYHSADGTRGLTVYGKISIPGAGLSGDYQGYSITLPTIPRASTTNAPDLVIGDNLTISISRASSAFTHTLVFSAYGVSKTLTGIGSSGTFSFTASEIASLYAGIPNSNTGSYGLVCVTYSGNTEVGRKTVYGTMRVVPSRAAPIFSAFDFSASRTDLTGDSSKIISGVSSVTVTIPVADKATSTTSASIVKYIASVGNATAEAPWSEDSYVYIEVPNAASGTVSVAAVDSRGNQTIVTKLGTLIPYTPPRVSSITTQRANSVDSAVSLQAQGVWDNKSFGLVTNTLSAQYRYKLTTAQAYSDPIAITLTINENSWQFNDTISGDLGVDGFTITSSFDVLLEITDAVPIAGSGQSLVDRGIPTMHMTQDGISVGQMMPSGLPDGVINAASGFAVDGVMQTPQSIKLYRANSLSLSNGGKVTFDTVTNHSDCFTHANGVVTIGPNCSRVRISATIGGRCVDAGRLWAHLIHNAAEIMSAIAYGVYASAQFTDIIDVSSGDTMYISVSEAAEIGFGGVPALLTVERIC